jgi:hypothetical protein
MDHEELIFSSFSLLSPTGLNMAIYKSNPQLLNMDPTIISHNLKPMKLDNEKE